MLAALFRYSKIIGILAFLFLQINRIGAQEEFVSPQSRYLTKIPMNLLTGGVIIIKATIDNYPDSLNFVLDTGSGGISLDSLTVEKLQLKTVKSERIIRGIAGLKKVSFTNDHDLKLPGLKVDSLDFHINDYDLLTSVYGVRIDGIIGYSFLRKFILKIDYDKQAIEIFTPGAMRYPRGGYLLKPTFTTLPLVQSIIEDERALLSRFIFDTGAGLCFILSQEYVTDSVVFKKRRKRYPTQAEGLGGKKMMDITVMKSIKIGPYKFRNVPVHIFEDEYNVTSYPSLGGIVGNDLLRRFNVILNYPDQSIHLKPNAQYLAPFDYSYTGLGVYLIDGEVRVIDVIPGSPGEKAGFKSGDVIFSIDNNFSKNIQQYKTILQNAGNRLKIVVFREAEPFSLTLEIKDIRKKW